MTLKLLVGTLALAIGLTYSTPKVLADPLPVVPPAPLTTPLTTLGLISHYSDVYGVSSTTLYATLKCESKLNPAAIGDHGHSFGIAQIYLPAHPTISKAEALDQEWAINWTAEQFSLGNAHMWTCWRLLSG